MAGEDIRLVKAIGVEVVGVVNQLIDVIKEVKIDVDNLKQISNFSNNEDFIKLEQKVSKIEEIDVEFSEKLHRLATKVNGIEEKTEWKYMGIDNKNKITFFSQVAYLNPNDEYVRIPNDNVYFLITKTSPDGVEISVEDAVSDINNIRISRDLEEAIESCNANKPLLKYADSLLKALKIKTEEPQPLKEEKKSQTLAEKYKADPLEEVDMEILNHLDKYEKVYRYDMEKFLKKNPTEISNSLAKLLAKGLLVKSMDGTKSVYSKVKKNE